MQDNFILAILDFFIKPQSWYNYSDLKLNGYRTISNKEEQRLAGALEPPERPTQRPRQFGLSPVKPYRDYYGTFRLQTRLLPEELEVKFAIGYAINSKLVTVDDYSNFSWLRMCTGINDILYPNLAHQKQLLDYILAHSKQPRFVVTRVYQYLQFELYQYLATEIIKQDSGQISGKSIPPSHL
ncbi:MAG TPA: hypothetical protein VEC37_10470 [Bacillota bacterium]|nr:hypothetical protein [Bacillota bacterium]